MNILFYSNCNSSCEQYWLTHLEWAARVNIIVTIIVIFLGVDGT